MALANLILETGQQQASYGAAVGQSLAALGQQVAKQIEKREYQKQAQAAIPAIQQAYTSALDKIEKGDLTGGYRDMIQTQVQFGATQNPFVKSMLEGAEKTASNAATQYINKMRYTSSTVGGEVSTGLPPLDPREYGIKTPVRQQPPTASTRVLGTRAPDTGVPLPEKGTEEDSDYVSLGEVPAESPSDVPEYRVKAQENVINVQNKPLEQQAEATNSYGVTNYDKDKYEPVFVRGVDKFIKGFEAFLVPKEEWIEKSARLDAKGNVLPTSEKVAPWARKNFFEGPGGGQKSTLQNVKDSVATMEDKKMTDLYKEFNEDIHALRAATSERGTAQKNLYEVETPKGNVQLTFNQYDAIRVLSGIVPAVADGAGGTPALFKEKQKTQEDYVRQAIDELGEGATDADIIKKAKELAGTKK